MPALTFQPGPGRLVTFTPAPLSAVGFTEAATAATTQICANDTQDVFTRLSVTASVGRKDDLADLLTFSEMFDY